MRFKGLDLNLLVALDALLTEKNVSVAARRVFVSQPAMSGALARLRAHFQDDLLILVKRRMVLTPFAEIISEPVARLMANISSTIELGGDFDPTTSRRTFRIYGSDFITDTLLSTLIPRISSSAPNLFLEIASPRGDLEIIENGSADLLIMASKYISPQHPAELLYEEDHVVAGWVDNPHIGATIDIETFVSLGHVAVGFGRNRGFPFAESEMNQRYPSRRIEVLAPSFTAVPKILVNTNRIAVVHKRFGEVAAQTLPIVIRPLPFELPRLRVMIQHHTMKTNDAGVQWLKALVKECV